MSYSDLVRVSTTAALLVGEASDSQAGPPGVHLLATTDGGLSWQARSVVSCVGWKADLSVARDGTLWVVCGGQPAAGNQIKSVARSFDGGLTWVQGPCRLDVTSPTYPSCIVNAMTGGYLGDVLALSGTNAFRGGGRDFLQVTHDGGISWALTTPDIGNGDGEVGGLYFANADDGWVVFSAGPDNGTLWRTIDSGNSWYQVWPIDIGASTCTSAQLQVRAGSAITSFPGFDGLVVTFTNTSSTPCELGGFPSVVAVDVRGHRVTAIETAGVSPIGGLQGGGPLPLVELQAGSVASAVIGAQSQPGPDQPACATYISLLVTAPWGKPPTTIAPALPGAGRNIPDCGPRPEVTAVVPGPTGSA